jgi:signal transduction histidine kinase
MAIALERPVEIGRPGSEYGDLGNGSLLERVALALNSTLELWEVLKSLAALTREATGADRCSIFLLEGHVLHPAAAIGMSRDDVSWGRFKAMGPIDLTAIPSAWEWLVRGQAIPVVDASTSPLIPSEWVERFGLRSVALVPLLVAGEPCGVMTLDYQRTRSFSEAELRLLEAIGSYAGVAVRNARLFEATCRRSSLQEGLARATAALVSPLDRSELIRSIVDGYMDLLGARLCAIGLVDPDHSRVDILAAQGTRHLSDSIEVADVPASIIERLQQQWGTNEPLHFEDDPWIAETFGGRSAGASRYLLIALTSEKHLRGGILLGFDADTILQPDERSAAHALAAIASAALERSVLLEKLARQLRHMEILHALGGAFAKQANADVLVARLNDMLESDAIQVVGLVFKDRSLSRRLGGDHPQPSERAAWRAQTGCIKLSDDVLSVPMRLDRRLVGALRVQPSDLPPEERSFLEALAHGVAEIASRGGLRAAVEEAARERAVAAERGRIAADLHDTAGQIFVAIGLLSRRESEHLPGDSPWRDSFRRLAELADAGKWEISRAIQALAFFPEARRGIAPSLRALTGSFERDSGINTLFEVVGSVTRLSPAVERSLYRVAHEALTNAWRHARCSTVRVELTFKRDGVRLTVADNGIGLRQGGEVITSGISGMRRALHEVGGSVRVRSLKPHGTLVEARIDRETR